MKNPTKILAALALVLALALVPLTACVGQTADNGDATGTEEAAEPIDVTGWKTMADAYAVADEVIASGSLDTVCVTVFKAGDNYIRVVSDYDPSYDEKSMELSFMDDDYIEKASAIFGDLAIRSAEDITSNLLDVNALSVYVGKTGQELMADGFVYRYCDGYGGEETYAAFDKGYFGYNVTFDVHVDDDPGTDVTAISNATITDIQYMGVSDSAIDPENLG